MQCFCNSGTSDSRKLVRIFHIGPHARQQHGEKRPIQHAIGMIGNNHDRTSCGDSRLICGTDIQTDTHLREQGFETKAFGRALHSPVLVSAPCATQERAFPRVPETQPHATTLHPASGPHANALMAFNMNTASPFQPYEAQVKR